VRQASHQILRVARAALPGVPWDVPGGGSLRAQSHPAAIFARDGQCATWLLKLLSATADTFPGALRPRFPTPGERSMEAVPGMPPNSNEIVDAIRQQTLAVEVSPFPVAYLDFSGSFLYATVDFPRPPRNAGRLEGGPLWPWIPDEHQAGVRAYF